jgi:putative zinc finger/helix-turn-helix YgiT family protein
MTQFCPTCEDYRATRTEEREETYTVRGRKLAVPVKAEVCAECGERLGSDEQDETVLGAVYEAYRREEDLLTPEQIKQIRKRYRLSQKSFAALLGMSEATVNRYEKGALQDQTHDTAIRACEKPEFVRNLLQRRGNLLSQWQRQRAEKALAGQAPAESDVPDWLDELELGFMPKEVSDRTGFRRFEQKRFAAVVLWFCRRLAPVSRTVINKLLFYADFLSFKTSTVSLTGSAYRRLQYGPVPTDYGPMLDWMEAAELLVCDEVAYPNGYTGYDYQVGPKAESLGVEFTAHEQAVLERVAGELGTLTAKAISDRSHEEPAWQNTEEKKIISYQQAMSLSLSLPE